MSDELEYVDTIEPHIEALIEWMAKRSQSFTLNYGEDTNMWECSWIVGGQRYTAVSYGMKKATWEALKAAGLLPLADLAAGSQYIIIWKKP